jgi:glycosyltransferase involved in cell wall biosynthesis
MKLLLVSQNPLTTSRGAPKVLIELADALRAQGSVCDLISPAELSLPPLADNNDRMRFVERLADHLEQVASEYDVVDYDAMYLPADRRRFSPTTLMVARSVLLPHHSERIKVPTHTTLRSRLSALLRGRKRAKEWRQMMEMATGTIAQADLVNVSNAMDRDELVRCGVPAEKIVVLPFGLSTSRRAAFEAVTSSPSSPPIVAFVGTFDYRKGACDFGDIFAGIKSAVPDARLRLLGTAGLMQTAEQVLSFFPKHLRHDVEVHPFFDPQKLPHMLADVSVGVFPSYIEGFGFGVLEMLAAGLPVIAYDAPGPPEMLPPKWLVPRGDTANMAARVTECLRNSTSLNAARQEARQLSLPFSWENIAQQTIASYTSFREKLLRAAGNAPATVR